MSHKPNEFTAVIDAVFAPNPQFPCTEPYNMGKTKVYKVEMPEESLVVRVVTDVQASSALQQEILEAIDDGVTARILHCETRQIGEQFATIQVQTYLPGDPLGCYPNIAEARAVAEATHTLQSRLIAVSGVFRAKGIPILGEISMGLISAVDELSMKQAARQLFENSRYQEHVSK